MAIKKQVMSKEKQERLLEVSKETLSLVRKKLSMSFNRVLVVRPTGFGKSYMLANLTTTVGEKGDLIYKRCLYIYPTDIIKEDVMRTYASDEKYEADMQKYDLKPRGIKGDNRRGMLNDCTDFLSYSWLTNRANAIKCKEETKRQLTDKLKGYDLIMLDECHRVGADGFQEAFKLFKGCIGSSTHLIGVTATPDRLDEADIVDVFGKKNQIEKYELEDAIKDGLLSKFDYVYAISDVDEYIDSCVETLNKLRIEDGALELTGYEEEEILERVDKCNLENVLKDRLILPIKDGEMEEHVGESNYAKFIVFMNNREEIHNKADEVYQEFKSAYPTMKINAHVVITKVAYDRDYVINEEVIRVSDTNELGDIEETENNIDLIFCVDKLNMGYHVESITGVVLYGDTSSGIKYNQQIGRCFSVKSCNKPIIIHMVHKFEKSPSLRLVNDKFKGVKVDLPSRLSKHCVDMFDYTFDVCNQAKKVLNKEYKHEDKIMFLYTKRGMSAIDICKSAGGIKLDTIVKVLVNNKIKLNDLKEILENKCLLSAELIEVLEVR
jgi:superfamily II DNA or RNA helicase